jgi:3-hydroxyacyl-CoA dehydrogenase
MSQFTKVAVIGAGTMGGGIAAHCANAGCQVVLLDMAPTSLTADEQAKGLTLESPQVKNRFVNAGMERIKKAKPAALFTPERADLIKIGNLTDDFDLIKDADWIVEVIVEQLEPKRALMERIEAVRKPGSIVSSNTSGIPIASIATGRSDEFRRHFLGTHFFNPPRYLYLLELIPTADTLPAVVERMRAFADLELGKGVIVAKDRPGFIANRIGTYAGQVRIAYAIEHGYSVEEVDSLTGELIGNPKTGTFRLYDLVGLDVPVHVARNSYAALTDDEEREVFQVPTAIEQMLAKGWLGNKTNVGFYKESKGASGREFWPLNLQTMEHQAPQKVRFELVGKARKIESLTQRLRFMHDNAGLDRAGQFLADTSLRILAYASRRIPEIADSPADIDRAMRWGYNQELGPFETWDAIGVRSGVAAMKERQIVPAAWVEAMLDQGIERFYRNDNGIVNGIYDPAKGGYVDYAPPEGVLVLNELRAAGRELERNESASLLDLGDGVLGFEFHSKVNAIDPLIIEMGFKALKYLQSPSWVGMVIGNQSNDFCAGVNLALVMMGVMGGQAAETEKFVRGTQQLFFKLRTSPKPVVAAPYGKVLGGGAEITMHASRRVYAAETYIGLVELGVGLIPGWGGCKEFIRRHVNPHMRANAHTDPLPYLQTAFETIALAKVAESGELGRQYGFFDSNDRMVMNRERLVAEAKKEVLAMVAADYEPPPAAGEPIYAIGRRGLAAVNSQLHGMRVGGFISEYDQKLAKALAFALCGGDLSQPQWVTEQYIFDLEYEQAAQLIQQPKTHERIMSILQSGKPLRN